MRQMEWVLRGWAPQHPQGPFHPFRGKESSLNFDYLEFLIQSPQRLSFTTPSFCIPVIFVFITFWLSSLFIRYRSLKLRWLIGSFTGVGWRWSRSLVHPQRDETPKKNKSKRKQWLDYASVKSHHKPTSTLLQKQDIISACWSVVWVCIPVHITCWNVHVSLMSMAPTAVCFCDPLIGKFCLKWFYHRNCQGSVVGLDSSAVCKIIWHSRIPELVAVWWETLNVKHYHLKYWTVGVHAIGLHCMWEIGLGINYVVLFNLIA